MRSPLLRRGILALLALLAGGSTAAPAQAGPQFVYVHNNSVSPGAPGRIIGARLDGNGRFKASFGVTVPPGQTTFSNDTHSLDLSPRLRVLVAATGTSLTTMRLDRESGRFSTPAQTFPPGATALAGVHVVEARGSVFVYATDDGAAPGAPDVFAFRVGPQGAVSPIGAFSTGAGAPAVGLADAAGFLVVVNRGGAGADALTLFPLDPVTGQLGAPVVNGGLTGCSVVSASDGNLFFGNCEDGLGGVTVLRPNAAGQLSVVAQAATANGFVNTVAARPRVLVALSVLPPVLGPPDIMESFPLRNGGIPGPALAPLQMLRGFPHAGWGLATFFTLGGQPLLVTAGNGAAGARGGPGEIRTFRVNVANGHIIPLAPKLDIGIEEDPFLRLPGRNNLTGIAVFQP
jgi:hypothetical protein